MAKPPRDRRLVASRTYFLTARTWAGRAVFQSERIAQLFMETLFHYRAEGKYELHEFVLMPNHVHLLLTPGQEVQLERAVQLIKGGFSHRLGVDVGRRLGVWQRGYVDHRIRDAADYARHRAYIQQNPVRAHLVSSPELYPYCSAHPGYPLDAPPQGLKPG